MLAGTGTIVLVGWLLAGAPLGIDAWLDVTSAPERADAIVCIPTGTLIPGVPTADGWRRVRSAVDLYADHYAPIVVFSGRGNERLSEAESYAQAGQLLGLPRQAIRLDPLPSSTAEHPATLLRSVHELGTGSRLLLVTSPRHSRRVLLTFRRSGFTAVRVVSEYRARTPLPNSPLATTSALPFYVPDHKVYDDVFIRLADRSTELLLDLREVVAVGVYRWKRWL